MFCAEEFYAKNKFYFSRNFHHHNSFLFFFLLHSMWFILFSIRIHSICNVRPNSIQLNHSCDQYFNQSVIIFSYNFDVKVHVRISGWLKCFYLNVFVIIQKTRINSFAAYRFLLCPKLTKRKKVLRLRGVKMERFKLKATCTRILLLETNLLML